LTEEYNYINFIHFLSFQVKAKVRKPALIEVHTISHILRAEFLFTVKLFKSGVTPVSSVGPEIALALSFC